LYTLFFLKKKEPYRPAHVCGLWPARLPGAVHKCHAGRVQRVRPHHYLRHERQGIRQCGVLSPAMSYSPLLIGRFPLRYHVWRLCRRRRCCHFAGLVRVDRQQRRTFGLIFVKLTREYDKKKNFFFSLCEHTGQASNGIVLCPVAHCDPVLCAVRFGYRLQQRH